MCDRGPHCICCKTNTTLKGTSGSMFECVFGRVSTKISPSHEQKIRTQRSTAVTNSLLLCFLFLVLRGCCPAPVAARPGARVEDYGCPGFPFLGWVGCNKPSGRLHASPLRRQRGGCHWDFFCGAFLPRQLPPSVVPQQRTSTRPQRPRGTTRASI